MREIYRILDANFNRAREALRVIEDCGRFALNDPVITAIAKNLRSDLREILEQLPADELVVSRDTPGDIGTELSSLTEPARSDLRDVAIAACKRLSEALRTVEEYSKVIAPDKTHHLERMRYDSYTLEQRVVGRLAVTRHMQEAKLYVLVSSDMIAGSVRQTVRRIIAGGADIIQLREKHTADKNLLAMAAEIRELTDETDRVFIVNDRPDIAAIVGADGVHLGQDDLPIAEARRLLRPGAIVGRSTHSAQQIKTAINEGADYIAVGPIFKTATKDAGSTVGTELLAEALELTEVPIVAVGGITSKNIGQVTAAGGKCVAVSSAVCGAEDPKSAASELLGAMT
ncbi:MAG: thiamine phosphate synthase [Planctomycetota bacterium]